MRRPIAEWDHWLAFGLLGLVGGKMLWESIEEKRFDSREDPTRGFSLVMLSVATSLDALAIGLSMGADPASPSGFQAS